ncbi:PD-(D/E)XK motif protein [Sphingomonas fuzhouensis]|uniref:PD-(D/E)XK motif protein n=1 Tax=Sphingomonas fuzhouensis TaxID=3106033 RepID=UPI002AFE4B72|nr:PD-(D/E)XK motif protein [Sphingomonas sp. SGZ-02]
MLNEWEMIAPPRDATVLNVLRADPAHPLDFRIGRDARGRFVFQLDALRVPPKAGSVESPAGMDVAVDDAGDGVVRLTLLLHDAEDFAIFRVLCGDLLEVTRPLGADDAGRAMGMLLGRLGHWQQVLARRRSGRLSRQEEMGLLGELLFLRDVLPPRIGMAAGVASWRGPYGEEQDFAVAGSIIEVKTQGASSDARIMVSSEDQLDTSQCPVLLCRQCIMAAAGDAGDSLDDVVAGLLAATAQAPAANARLRGGLDAAGWAEGVGYDARWSLVERSWYHVGDGFPRIVRSDLLPGVSRVRYQVAVADCLPFRIDEAEAFGS